MDSTVGDERKALIEKLKSDLHNYAEGAEPECASENSVLASYLVALKIGKTGRPFSDGEFVKECLVECSQVLCTPSSAQAFESIALSANTVKRRIIEMASDMREQLVDAISGSVYCSLALDESTDINDIAQLAVFIRLVDSDFDVKEELLDLIPLKDTTTGEDIFNAVFDVLENINFDFCKLVSVATDGAGAMLSDGSGFVGRLQRKVKEAGLPPIKVVHCMLHQEQLCAKNFKDFHSIVAVVTRCVNFCRKQGLNHRQFKEFLREMDAELCDIPFYCRTRWLSCAKTLNVFFSLIEEIEIFMGMKGNSEPLLENKQWIADLAFLADITKILSDLNISVQGTNKLIGALWARIQAFKVELALYQQQLNEKSVDHFPCLQKLDLSNIRLDEYSNAIAKLRKEFDSRFKEIEDMEPELNVFMTPFSVSVQRAPVNFQLELIRIQHDSILKDRYYHFNGDLASFYKGVKQQDYPRLNALALKCTAMFSTTYVCEQLFSLMKSSLNVKRSSMSDISLQSQIRLQSSKTIVPNLTKLVQAKRCQSSS